jgi:predicted transcriptional regulator
VSITQGIKLDETTQMRLKHLGQLRQRTPHWLMKEAIEAYLDREERYEQEKQEDMARWEDYSLTGIAVSQSDVTAWLSNLTQGKVTPCPK